MKIKEVTITNFRRFTDLKVDQLPEEAKLIILFGPNGCGKSSFLDALNHWFGVQSRSFNFNREKDYFVKVPSEVEHFHDAVKVSFHGDGDKARLEDSITKLVYVRTAYRNYTKLEAHQIRMIDQPLHILRAWKMADNDDSMEKNYKILAGEANIELRRAIDEDNTAREIEKVLFGDIKHALDMLFSDLKLSDLGNPFTEGTPFFSKGTSKRFPLMNLSSGEKAALDLVLDLVVARRSFDDTCFCIDEPESHLHPRLQAKLLSVLYDLVPTDNCQLLLATHSIGMMRKAMELNSKYPGSVLFLDFGGRNFDSSERISPIVPDHEFWKKTYQVTLGDLANLIAPDNVVLCEGDSNSTNTYNDAECYNVIFENYFPRVRFISVGNCHDVENDTLALRDKLLTLLGGINVFQLRDRDNLSDREAEELRGKKVRVLTLRNLESYMLDDEVLTALAESVGKEEKTLELLAKKREILEQISMGASDDLKPGAQKIFHACKSILGLTQCGSNLKSFMRDTLSPLIKPGMAIYDRLEQDIFHLQQD